MERPELNPRQSKEVLQAARSGDLATLRRLVKDWRSTDFSDQEQRDSALCFWRRSMDTWL